MAYQFAPATVKTRFAFGRSCVGRGTGLRRVGGRRGIRARHPTWADREGTGLTGMLWRPHTDIWDATHYMWHT